jgi:PTS system beta-glucosides-specific IIC component
VLPIVMSAALLAVLEVRLRKSLPKVLAPMFAPLLAMAITLPAALCALGPLGSWCGNALGAALFSLGDQGGLVTVLGVGIIAASWEFLVIAGMRSLLLALGLANMLAVGTDSFVLVGAGVAIWAAFGMALGGFLRLRGTSGGRRGAGLLCLEHRGRRHGAGALRPGPPLPPAAHRPCRWADLSAGSGPAPRT